MNYYGFDFIIKKYLGFPSFLSLPCHLEHGWTKNTNALKTDLRAKKKLMLVFSKRRLEAWKNQSKIRAEIIGSPFVLYREMERIEKEENAQGTVAFPAHSGTHIISYYNIVKYCKDLKGLPNNFHPITVCLYYKDYNSKAKEIFLEKGFKVVTAGTPFHKEFSYRFYNILKSHKYSTSNEVGSAAFYSIEMNIPFFIKGDLPDEINNGKDPNVPLEGNALSYSYGEKAYKLFSKEPFGQITEEQKLFVTDELGINDRISKEELKKAVWNNYLKYEVPFILRRKFRKSIKYFYLLSKSIIKFITLKFYKIIFQPSANKNALKRISESTVLIDPFLYLNKQKINSLQYKYSDTSQSPHLYSLIYSVLTLSILDKIPEDNGELIKHIQSYQDKNDGLFKDKSLSNEIANGEDWWGWRHLTPHCIMALHAMGAKPLYQFRFIEPLFDETFLEIWFDNLDWDSNIANTSNTIMNYGVCMQYTRDVWNSNMASKALNKLFNLLDQRINPQNGLWGSKFNKNQNPNSQMVQAAYHFWTLYFYDNRKIKYIEKAIDSCLLTQNKFGGFGPGYNLEKSFNPFSSACEDIDSIFPLVYFYFKTDYRKNDIKAVIDKSINWILFNQNKDGGFVFRRNEQLVYGHPYLSSKKNESNMFATWFRMLTLSYASLVSDNKALENIKFNFTNCPGYQYQVNNKI